jgi:hypothetical protein
MRGVCTAISFSKRFRQISPYRIPIRESDQSSFASAHQ